MLTMGTKLASLADIYDCFQKIAKFEKKTWHHVSKYCLLHYTFGYQTYILQLDRSFQHKNQKFHQSYY